MAEPNEPQMPDAPDPRQAGSAGPDRRPAAIFTLVMVVVIGVVVAVLVLGSDDEEEGAGGGEAAAECESVDEPAPKDVNLPPPDAKKPSAEAVVFETNCGSFTVELDAERAPKTAASFQYLAEEGVYDGTGFHRIAPGFVIQGGDPAGDGSGGPGFSVEERPPANLTYSRGLVAMAKTGAEPPGTSGSQFFVVTAEADAGLPPDFALVGEISDGFETIARIEALGAGPGSDGPPSAPVVIESATVEG